MALGLVVAATVGFAIGSNPLDTDRITSFEQLDKIELTNPNATELSVEPAKHLALENGTVIVPIPRPKTNPNYCPRDEEGRNIVENAPIIDDSIPQHCLEKNCGIGIYSKGKEDTIERCTYCGAAKPVSL